MLFPFMEQSALFDVASTLTNPWPNVDENHAVSRNVPTLRCPSDSHGASPSFGIDSGNPNARQAVINIMISRGDSVVADSSATNDGQGGSTYTRAQSDNNGYSATRGMFFYNIEKDFGSVSDGTSNTILISETVLPSEPSSRNIRGGTAVVSTIEGSNWTYNANNCMNAPKSGREFTGTAHRLWRGGRMLDGQMPFTGFNTILPPNAMSCVNAATDDAGGFRTANSNHSGGVNTARVDGSVSFITDSIDTGGLPTVPNGRNLQSASPFGVWGALGTPQGGESRSL